MSGRYIQTSYSDRPQMISSQIRVGLALSFFLAAPAHSQMSTLGPDQTIVLTPATSTTTFTLDNQSYSGSYPFSDPFSFSAPIDFSGIVASLGGTGNLDPNLSLLVSSSIQYQPSTANEGFIGGNVGVELTASYQLVVVGPPSLSPVPVDFRVNMNSAAAGYDEGSSASFSTVVGGSASAVSICTCGTSSFGGNIQVNESVGEADTINMAASTFSGILPDFTQTPFTFNLGGSATAFVDPYAFVDPSFANASEYSIVVSPGVGNARSVVAAVPEPSTYAAMLLGLGMLGAVVWRRKTQERISNLPAVV